MIRILTDSASDLTATDSARPGVYTVPLSVTFADGTGGLGWLVRGGTLSTFRGA